jgi:CheY-like chemotaxis protein
MSVIVLVLFCAIVFTIGIIRERRRVRSSTAADHGFTLIGRTTTPEIPDRYQPQPETARSLKKIRVLVVDDHEIVRRGLAGLLKAEPDVEVAGEAGDGESAVRLARKIRPDVVLMDVCLPGIDGIQATRVIHNELPGIRVIALTMMEDAEGADAMREAGAVSYLTKAGSSDAMISAIRAA